MAGGMNSLRNFASEMTKDLPESLRKVMEEKAHRLKDMDEGQLKEEMDRTTESVKRTVLNKVDDVNETVKGLAPTKPLSWNYNNLLDYNRAKYEYEQDMEAYRTVVATTTTVLDDFLGLIGDIFESLRNFFRELWNTLKRVVVNIAKKVGSFIVSAKDKVVSFFRRIFS